MTGFPEVQLKVLAEEPVRNGLGEAAGDGDDAWPRYVRITDIANLFELKESTRVALEPQLAAHAPLRRGDLVLASVGATVGTAHLYSADDPACYAGYLTKFRGNESLCHRRYVAYWTQSTHYLDQIATGAVQSTIQNFSASKYASMRVPCPTVEAQRTIAEFLDRETAQIDATIDAQQRLVDLLSVRKRSLLDGALETAWSFPLMRLKHLYRSSSDARSPEREVLSVYRDYGVIPKSSRDDNLNVTPENLDRYLVVRRDDLVVNRMKAWQGSLGISPHEGIVSGDYEVLRPLGNAMDPSFAHVLLRSPRLIGEYRTLSTGIRPAQWRLYWDAMSGIRVPVPPIDVQKALVREIGSGLGTIDRMREKVEVSMALLRERRGAVITAAVTGRLDPSTGVERVEDMLEGAAL